MTSLPALDHPAALCGDDAGQDAHEEDGHEGDGEGEADGQGRHGGDQRQGDHDEGQGAQQDVADALPEDPLETAVRSGQGCHFNAAADAIWATTVRIIW